MLNIVSPPRTIAYGTGSEQFAELYLPSDATTDKAIPVVCLIHGGFWQTPYTLELMRPVAHDLCRSGVAVWNVEYRRCGPTGGGGGFSTTQADVCAAVDWLAGDAARSYGLDASRVALVGHSAGAQLALWSAQRRALPEAAGGAGGDSELTADALGEATALRSSLASTQRRVRPRCIVSADGVLDLAFARSDPRQPQGRRAVESFLSGGDRISDATLNARLALSSPIDLLPPAATSERRREPRWLGVSLDDVGIWSEGEPVLGLVHGLRDPIVPADHSARFAVAASVADVECTYRQVRSEGHFEVLDGRRPGVGELARCACNRRGERSATEGRGD